MKLCFKNLRKGKNLTLRKLRKQNINKQINHFY